VGMNLVGVNAVKVQLTGLALILTLASCAEKEVILQGERFPVRADLAASVPVEGAPAPVAASDRPENQSVPINLPGANANADWTHRGGTARHQQPHGSLSASPQLIFAANIGAGNSRRNRISASPVVADGRVFTIDSAAQLVATATNGGALWTTDLTASFDRGGGISGGGLAYGAGRVFATTPYGEVVAVDPASGGVVWRQRLDVSFTGAPATDGTSVYVAGRDGSSWAISAADGTVNWTVPGLPSATGALSAAAPGIDDRAVVFPFASGVVTAILKEGGTQAWSAPVAGQRLGRAYAALGDVTGDPVIDGGVIYVGTSAGRTLALSTSGGEQIWAAGEGAMGPLLPVGGSLFMVNDEGLLVRLDQATGETIWAVQMPYYDAEKTRRRESIIPHFGPVLAGGRIVVASGDGALRFFDPTNGASLGTVALPGGAASQPALAGGVLYVVSQNGQLLAFR
jgi:outer membrane protein assembly factor BamB